MRYLRFLILIACLGLLASEAVADSLTITSAAESGGQRGRRLCHHNVFRQYHKQYSVGADLCAAGRPSTV